MSKILLFERFVVPAFQGDRSHRVLAEGASLKKYGLSEDEYLAAVDADLGSAGLINGNHRLYQPSEWIPENVKLSVRAPLDFIAAEKEHPEYGPTLNVAARIVRVEVTDVDGAVLKLEQAADGSWRLPLGEDGKARTWPTIAKARGTLAFLRTTEGSNLWILHRAGMPLGTSSRGFGASQELTLDEKSPWAEANKDFVGRKYELISDYELVTYDVVATPSAGTYLHTTAPQSEARRAYLALVESAVLPPPDSAGGSITTGRKNMTLKEFLEQHADLAKEIQAEAVKTFREGNPQIAAVADLAPEKVAMLTKLAAAMAEKGASPDAGNELAEQIKRLADAAEKGTARQTTLEAQVAQLRTSILAEQKARADAEKALAERATKDAIAKALTDSLAKVHTKIQPDVQEWVSEEIAAGRIAKAEDVGPEVERVAKRLHKLAIEAVPAPAAAPPADHKDDTPPAPAATPDVLSEAFATVFGENWQDGLAKKLGRTPTPSTPTA